MRVVHLCFRLHEPFTVQEFEAGTPYFESKEAFTKANQEIYQPFFALLERNTQKNKGFRVSLVVSGLWIELAERYDSELIRRLKKLVSLGQVELVAEPYYHSLAFFYDKSELSHQVKQYQAKVQSLFGAKTQIFCLPEFIYNDAVGKWAEEAGFAGMLAGSSRAALGWHSVNHVYEAVGCEYLRILFRNAKLSDAVMYSEPEVMAEQVVDKEKQTKKMMLSVVKFQKMLDLEFVRGGLVNLYMDAECMKRLREVGVVAFFDEWFERWLDGANNKFATASMACVVEAPSMEVAVPEAVSWWRGGIDEKSRVSPKGTELVVDLSLKLPAGLNNEKQLKFARELYGLRREVLASEDEKLADDFRHLLAVDYQKDLTEEAGRNYQKILQDLKSRAESIKKQQAVEISRTFTKRHDRGDVDQPRVAKPVERAQGDDEVAVHFGSKRQAGLDSREMHATAKPDSDREGVVEVHRLSGVGRPSVRRAVVEPMAQSDTKAIMKTPKVITVRDENDEPELGVVSEADDVDEMMNWAGAKEGETINEAKKGIKHSIRRVIKKLVIE